MQTLIQFLFILISIAAIGYAGYNVGQILGRGMAESAIINYFKQHPMSLSEELIRDLYPLRSAVNPVVERPTKIEHDYSKNMRPEWIQQALDRDNRLIIATAIAWLIIVIAITIYLYY